MELTELAQRLRTEEANVRAKNVVTGFDAFVDEMLTPLRERVDLETVHRVETINEFGELAQAAAGQSSLREVLLTSTDPGGCAVNMGDGLATLGAGVHTFATAGEPVHPAFADYQKKATLTSWGREPGRTLAFEFADGKLMYSAVSQLADFAPGALRGRLADGAFLAACQSAGLIALTDWTLYPHMTACWKVLQAEVWPQLDHRPDLLVDLVDPSSRSAADIRAMIEALPGFEPQTRLVLGLNQNEANILSRLLAHEVPAEADPGTAEQQARQLREAIGISEVVVHGRAYASAATESESTHQLGPLCPKPRKSTGAGDRFNAGYALAALLKFPLADRLKLAKATSGLYVRLGRSPHLTELADFLDTWGSGNLAE
jgi:sugar/nucleoside kinase (ribokinase family)